MGKKSRNEKKLETVSIVTINQIKRQDTIKLTAQHINNQTYKNIIEWVIVEGSKNLEDCIANEQNIKELSCKIPIVNKSLIILFSLVGTSGINLLFNQSQNLSKQLILLLN